jgi:hypothetical protein
MKSMSDKTRARRSASGESTSSSFRASKGGLRKTGKIKPKKRSKKERERIYGTDEHIAFVKSQPCVACKREGPSEFAHVGNGGTGRKSAAKNGVPLCGLRLIKHGVNVGCHALSHLIGIKSFEAKYGIDLKAEAARVEAAWQSHLRGE